MREICRCGFKIHINPIPFEGEFFIIPEKWMDIIFIEIMEVFHKYREEPNKFESCLGEIILKYDDKNQIPNMEPIKLLECPECGRIRITGVEFSRYYTFETDTYDKSMGKKLKDMSYIRKHEEY